MNEEKSIALYFTSILYNTKMQTNIRERFIDWVEKYSIDLFDCKLDFEEEEEDINENSSINKLFRKNKGHYSQREINLERLLDFSFIPKSIPKSGTASKKANVIAKTFHLNEDETELMRIIVFYKEFEIIKDLIEDLTSTNFNPILLSWLLQKNVNHVKKTIDLKGNLHTKGLIENDAYCKAFDLTSLIDKILKSPCRNEKDIKKVILEEKAKTNLTVKDFNHINDTDILINLLKTSLQKQEKGTNLLLYGAPGTGKTEFAKAICKAIKADLYMLSENSCDDSKKDRIAELKTAETLTKDDENAVLLLDEAEDIFYRTSLTSKMFINRLLEKNQTPVIWISNNIRWMDPAYLRRYTYAIEFPEPPESVRENLWKNIAKKNKFKLSTKKATEYAKKYEISASFINQAIKSAVLLGDESMIDKTIQSLKKAITGKAEKESNVESKNYANFNTDILNTDIDLKVLAKNLEAKQTKRFSLCLFGAAGTGKSAYARYLADKLKIKVHHKRASDLISPYVGETEKNIAEAFKQAGAGKALLIFDEADSFLQDRSMAHRSWEISQVNEMLTWMESHPYPFICTTNLMESLDKASLRRFTFKVKYDYLNPEQVQKAFKHFFNKDASFGELTKLDHLAPGDFMVVKNKAEILEIENKYDLIEMLQSEQEAKGIITKPKIGF